MKGEEPKLTKLAPRWSLEEVARHAVDFWLTTEDVPKPDNRVTVDRDGHVHLAYKPTNDAEADGLYDELRKVLNHIGIAAHHVLAKNFYASMDMPVAGWLTSQVPAGSAPIRRPPSSTSTARRTRSTTCTSWTRVSSRASEP